jgi:hypothetical protein
VNTMLRQGKQSAGFSLEEPVLSSSGENGASQVDYQEHGEDGEWGRGLDGGGYLY